MDANSCNVVVLVTKKSCESEQDNLCCNCMAITDAPIELHWCCIFNDLTKCMIPPSMIA